MPSSFQELSQALPFKSRFVDIQGHRMHYFDEGNGEPLVLVHGNPSWCFMFRRLIPLLTPAFRVLVPDHIGCGLSDKPEDRDYRYTLSRRVSDFERFLDLMQIEKTSLVLHDWGGPIGISYAVRNPKRIDKIALFNTAGFLLPRGKSIHWTLRWCRRSLLAALLIRGANAFSVGATQLGISKRLSRDVRKAYQAPYNSWKNRIAVLRFIQDIPLDAGDPAYEYLEETQEKLTRLKDKPLAIFWGEADFIFDLDFLAEWVRRFPDAEVHRYSEGGHYLLEDCFDVVAPELKEFLEGSE